MLIRNLVFKSFSWQKERKTIRDIGEYVTNAYSLKIDGVITS